MVPGNTIGFVERTFRLKRKQVEGITRFAWIFDDNGEIYHDRLFITQGQAQAWMQSRGGGTALVVQKLKD
jgi:hypothetical protein